MPGFFSNTLAVLRREIHRVARQPMYWLLTVILPIVAFAFFAVLLYKGVARDIPIAVVDQDNSTLSRKVTQMIDATPTAWVAYGVQGMEEAERLMLQGKVMGIVLIPDFFEKNILNNSQTHLKSYLTGTNITVNYEGENETYIEASVENSSSILYDKEIRNKPRTRRTKRNV